MGSGSRWGRGRLWKGRVGKDDFRSFALMFGLKILGQAGDEDGVRSGSSMMSWSVAALRASSCRRMGK